MHKSIEDKLWFTRFLDMPTFQDNAVVIDYGCADGALIKVLARKYPNIFFIGTDCNDKMLQLAKDNCKGLINVAFDTETNLPSLKDKKVILIMSSVFHELMSYYNYYKFLEDFLPSINPDYIFFRDMAFNESSDRKALQSDIEKINKHPLYEDYYRTRGKHYQYWLLNFLLKYRYTQNWERERDEVYVPTYFEYINIYFPNYNIIYSKHYILPFLKDKVMEDFGINLVDKTHCNIIFKRK